MLTLRKTIGVAGALLLAHALTLAVWGHEGPGPVISSLIQLSLGLLCVTATLAASRKGGTFERRFLLLVAARYVIFMAGQALAAYYERDITWEFEGSLPDVIFHLEDVPLGIAFFLDPGRESDRAERSHPLDLLQIVVFWTALALYVRYFTSDSPIGVGLGAATAALVAGCFYIRALTSSSTVASVMFGRWTPAIMISSVNNAYSGYYNSIAGAGFDLVWSLEMLIWIATTATWRPMRFEQGTGSWRTVDRTVYLLPLVVACFSLVLSLGLAQRHVGMAAILVGSALGFSVLRAIGRRRARQERVRARPAGS